MRQQVDAGSKVRPKLADHQGCGRPLGQRNGFGGRGEEGRGPRRLTGPGESRRASPDSRHQPQESGSGRGKGTRQGPGRRRTLLSPPTARLGPRWEPAAGPAVLAPPPQLLPSGSHGQGGRGPASTGAPAAHTRAWRKGARVEHA